jgi:hypothetical protein
VFAGAAFHAFQLDPEYLFDEDIRKVFAGREAAT